MPKRTDLQSILVLGSAPIVISQAAEFDCSGTQAVRALREEGFRVILVNSNLATIMTDPRGGRRVPTSNHERWWSASSLLSLVRRSKQQFDTGLCREFCALSSIKRTKVGAVLVPNRH
ncbi:MAG TPA: hypothetical protein VFY65_15990 [Longimicrobium sp.]|nr:hypothetical protein [Longimicrobium sp.]